LNIKQRFNELRQTLKDRVSQHALDAIERHYYQEINGVENEHLKSLKELEISCATPYSIESVFRQYLLIGKTWPQLHHEVQSLYFKMALDLYKTHKEAAKHLGISRTTIGEHFKRVKDNEISNKSDG
jgi:hypothetical protein